MGKEKFTELMKDLFNRGQLYIPSEANLEEWIETEYNKATQDKENLENKPYTDTEGHEGVMC